MKTMSWSMSIVIGDPSHSHRFVAGKLAYASKDKKEIKLWTPEGKKKFDVQTGR